MRRNKCLVLIFIGILFGTLILNIARDWNSCTNQPNDVEDQTTFQSDLAAQTVITKDSMSETGANIKTGLYTNISALQSLNSPYYEEPGYKYFDLPIDTNYQNITQTNLTFSEIRANTTVQSIEENPEGILSNLFSPFYWVGMSFKISTPCKLQQLQLFVQEVNPLAIWSILIYNATRDLSADLYVIPDTYTKINSNQSAFLGPTPAAHWHNFTFPNVQLNMSNTYIDAKGFAYYFFIILMPRNMTAIDLRFLYYSYDEAWIDDGWAYHGIGMAFDLLEADICMRIKLAPLSNNPTPSDIQLAVKNLNRPPISNVTVEMNHSLPVAAAYNNTAGTSAQILSQNFNLTDYGTVHNITLYMKCSGAINTVLIGIFPNNNTGIGPLWDANLLYDWTLSLNIPNGFEGWYTFSMIDKPNLKPGQYWWLLVYQGLGNLTVYGSQDPPDKAVALNITALTYHTHILPGNIASIVGIQYGRELFNVIDSWISDMLFLPDVFGVYHYVIVTRWVGITRFNVIYSLELENIKYIQPIYFSNFQSNSIPWNLSIQATFPTTTLGKVINLTVPNDWDVRNVTRNGVDHGVANWSIYQFPDYRIVSIINASNAKWTIWCNSSVYQIDYTVLKLVGGQYEPAVNATVYDRLRMNITIVDQWNGICQLTVFYPDGKTIFINQTLITTENILLSWYPENDSAATGGNYTFIVHWSNGTEVGFSRRFFFFTPIPTTLTLISSLPSPYVNDNTKNITIWYRDSRGVNITGATFFANLYGSALEWEDLYSISLNPLKRGLYLIRLNTIGLNASQSYPLSVSAQKEGYNNVSLATQQILVRPVPTTLVTNVQNITQYQNQIISFSCSFKDNFHATGIDWASIGFDIVGTSINGSLTSIMPGESVYITGNVALSNLIEKTLPYVINITAIARNCEPTNITINLFVLNKTSTILTLTTPSGLIIQGQSLQIQAHLQNGSSLLGISGATIRFSFGGIIPERIALTDSNGIATIEIATPDQPFTVTAFFDEISTTKGASASTLSVSVLTYADLTLWIGIIAGVCVGSILAVRQLYFVPKRKRQMQQYQKIANKFQDIANLRQLIILHKESGGCLYQQSFGGEFDADLISGFLSAISSFQTELKPEKALQKGLKSGGFQLSYQDYKILLFDGSLIRLALIVDELPSEEFRKLAQSFVGEYEERYGNYLMAWRGDIGPFKDSYHFIATSLEITLIWPHQLKKPASSEKLNSLEESAIKIADTIMKSQAANYFFLPLVISMGQAGAPRAKLEIIATAYKLRYRNIFNPVDPSTITS